MMEYDRVQLKEAAKAAIRETQPKTWKATILYLVLGMLIPTALVLLAMMPMFTGLAEVIGQVSMIPYAYINEEQLALQMVFSLLGSMGLLLVVSIIIGLYQMVMRYGYAGWALKIWRGEPTGTGGIFGGFHRFGGALGSAIMVGIFTWLWSLLFTVPGAILQGLFTAFLADGLPFLASLLNFVVSVLMMIGSIWVSYRYCLTPFFIMADPKMGVFEAIRNSKNAMRGRIAERFVLDLSFLGWDLLVGLIVGVVTSIVMFAVIFGSVFAMVAAAEGDLEWALATDPQLMVDFIMSIFGGCAVACLVGTLVSLPLTQWLTAYQEISAAGYFCIVTGWASPEEAAPQADPGPAVPPQPARPIEPAVPAIPPEAPRVPEAPAVPEAPTEPVIPEAPAVPEVPEVPEGPVPEAPVVPETPAEPAAPEAPAEPAAPAEPETPAEPEHTDTPEA